MKRPFISKTDSMFLFTQMRAVSDHPVVAAAAHGGNTRGGAFDQITNAIQMSANVNLLCFLASSEHCDYYQWCVCSESSPRAKRWPVHSSGDSHSRLKSRLTCYLYSAVSHCNYPSSSPIPTWPRSATAIHRLEEKYGPLSHTASSYLEKAQKASLLVVVSSLTQGWSPHSISLFSLLLLLGELDIYAGENYYFSISRSTQKKENGIPHLARPTHLVLYLFLCTLFSSFVIDSFYPPHPTRSTALLPFPFLLLSVSLAPECVCRSDCWHSRISRWSWKRIKEPQSRESANRRAGLASCCRPSAEANY